MKDVRSNVSEFLKHVQLFDLIKYTYVRTGRATHREDFQPVSVIFRGENLLALWQLSCGTFKFIMTRSKGDTHRLLYAMRISRMRIDKREDAVLDQTKASRRATELKPSLWLNSFFLLLLCTEKNVQQVQTIPACQEL